MAIKLQADVQIVTLYMCYFCPDIIAHSFYEESLFQSSIQSTPPTLQSNLNSLSKWIGFIFNRNLKLLHLINGHLLWIQERLFTCNSLMLSSFMFDFTQMTLNYPHFSMFFEMTLNNSLILHIAMNLHWVLYKSHTYKEMMLIWTLKSKVKCVLKRQA